MDKNSCLNKGFQHFAKQEYDLAMDQFQIAIDIDPDFDLAYNALAEVFNKKGDLDMAIEMARKVVAINPDDPLAHTALSRYYVQKGMIREAEDEMAISNRLAAKK